MCWAASPRRFCLLHFQEGNRGRGSEEWKSCPKKPKWSDSVTTNEGHWEEKLKASLLQECNAALGWCTCTLMSNRQQSTLPKANYQSIPIRWWGFLFLSGADNPSFSIHHQAPLAHPKPVIIPALGAAASHCPAPAAHLHRHASTHVGCSNPCLEPPPRKSTTFCQLQSQATKTTQWMQKPLISQKSQEALAWQLYQSAHGGWGESIHTKAEVQYMNKLLVLIAYSSIFTQIMLELEVSHTSVWFSSYKALVIQPERT